jgi:hypothetical protein
MRARREELHTQQHIRAHPLLRCACEPGSFGANIALCRAPHRRLHAGRALVSPSLRHAGLARASSSSSSSSSYSADRGVIGPAGPVVE